MALPQQLLPNFVALPTPPASSIRLGPPVPTSACGSRAHLAAGVSCGLGCSGDFNGFGGKEGEGQEEAGQTATLWPQETQEWTLGYEEQTRLFV